METTGRLGFLWKNVTFSIESMRVFSIFSPIKMQSLSSPLTYLRKLQSILWKFAIHVSTSFP
jgi:hypothetical protein